MFKIKFLSKEESEAANNVDPYCICDGGWGGMGPQVWFTFDWSGKNVFETGTRPLDKFHAEPYQDQQICQECWKRVWDDIEKHWRDVTPEELSKLPELREHGPIGRFEKFSFPLIKTVSPSMIPNDLVDVCPMGEPMKPGDPGYELLRKFAEVQASEADIT